MASSPYATGRLPRGGKKQRKPEDVHDRPTALTKRQQQEQADARVQGAKQAQLATSKGQAKLATSERAREPARKADKYRRDVRRQVANPSIADRVAGGLFKGAASGLGLDQLVDDAIWSFTNPVDRVTNKGRSAGEQQMIWPGFGKAVSPVRTGPPVAPRRVPVKYDPMSRYASAGVSHEEMVQAMPRDRVHLYHSTAADDIGRISREGLRPGKERPGEVTGVYFAEDGTDVLTLRPGRKRSADVWLRVRRDKVNAEATDMYDPDFEVQEWVSREGVSADDLEYFGADGGWHPLIGRQPVKGVPQIGPKTQLEASGERVLEALGPVRGPIRGERGFEAGLLTQQERLRSAARRERFGKAGTALQGDGDEAWRAALSELKGALPKLEMGPLELDEATSNILFRRIRDHPDLKVGQKIKAEDGLRGMMEGELPQRNQALLLQQVFGAKEVVELIGAVPRATRAALDIANIPRATKSSGDLSGLFRQPLVLFARNPAMWGREVPTYLKAAKKEETYEALMRGILDDPDFAAAQRHGVSFTDLVHTREDGFHSIRAEKLPLFIGRIVRASSRGYTAFLNSLRMAAFKNYLRAFPDADDATLDGFGRLVNVMTGRGGKPGGFIEQHGPGMNFTFFSPQLFASRFHLLNPKFYKDLPKPARREAYRSMAQLAGMATATLALVELAGYDVIRDPRSADFGKIKLGDTRIDIMGGFQQFIVLYARLYKNESINSNTGALKELNNAFRGASRLDILGNFFLNKLAPLPGLGRDFLKGVNFDGEPFSWRDVARVPAPLGWEQTYDAYVEHGPAAAAATFGLGGIGFGVQTYNNADQQRKSSKSSGGNPYAGRSKKGRSPYATGRGGGRSPYAGG